MDPFTLALVLLAVAVVLALAEFALPTHGILGILAGIAAAGAVVCFFLMGSNAGLTALLLLVIALPVVAMAMLRMWPHTPIGRRLTLNAVTPPPETRFHFAVGKVGRAMTELRPLGECDFDDRRCEAVSELGIIPAGSTVQVVALEADGRPIVRRQEKA